MWGPSVATTHIVDKLAAALDAVGKHGEATFWRGVLVSGGDGIVWLARGNDVGGPRGNGGSNGVSIWGLTIARVPFSILESHFYGTIHRECFQSPRLGYASH